MGGVGWLVAMVPVVWPWLTGARPHIGVVISFWALLFVLVTAAFWRFDRIVAREPNSGYCAHCGYDLTDNTSGVCPECGESI